MNSQGMDVAPRETRFALTNTGFRVELRRNCSISPRGLALVFGALAALAVAIASAFAAFGAWLVLPFAGLEVGLLGAAFLYTARHATDFERIESARERLTVDVSEAGRRRCYELDPRGARVRLQDGRVLLQAMQARLEVGRHLDAASRARFAAELGRRLQS